MKPIKLTDELKQHAMQQFQKLLDDLKLTGDLKMNITTETLLTAEINKPYVFITAPAYVKLMGFVNASSDELAWHGTVVEQDGNYLIDNVMLYPQTVTTTTVDSDDAKYNQWLMELSDETINALHFQGHSHVNMAVTPSGRDTTNWDSFLQMLREDEFYIFCIANKRAEFYWTIYDNKRNVMFENKDITMLVVDEDGEIIDEYIKDQIKTNITKHTPLVTKNWNPYDYKALPSDMEGTVEYDSVSDMYFSDEWRSGFRYNNTYQTYTMSGKAFRNQYNTTATKTKTKTTSTKKGGTKK